MKIKRYSMGGLHYTADLPSSNSPQSASANTQSAKKEDNTIQKEIINIIKEHGVTNDVNYFTNAVSQMLSSTANMDPFSNSTDYTMAQLLRIQNLANRVKRSSKLYDNAVNRIDAENSDADVAITSTGALYVQHEGKLKTISASEYSKNPDEYTPVTTGDLMKVREYDPSLVFNTSILTDLSGQVGMKTIIDYLRTTITAYGKIEKSSSNSQYSTKQLNDIDKGLVQMFGNNPVFKNTIKTTVSDQAYTASASAEERSHQINAAANYLWSTLNGDMQNVLRANAALRSRIDKNSSPVDIILQAINAHTDHSITQDIDSDYEGSLKNGKLSKGSESTSQVQESFGNMVIKDHGAMTNIGYSLGTGLKQNYPGFRYGNVENHKTGHMMPKASTLSESYDNLQGHGLVNTMRTAYFGDIPIQDIASTGQSILVDNSKGGVVVYLPTINGNIDFNMMQQMNDVYSKIVADRITDPVKLRKIWEDNGFQYDEQKRIGIPIGYTLTPYWTQVAFTSTRANIVDDKIFKRSNFLETVDDSRLESLMLTYNTDPTHKNNPKLEIDPRAFGVSKSGLIYIPLNDNQNEVLVASNTGYINKPNVDNIAARQQATAYDPNTGYSHAQGYNSNILD